MFTVNDWINNFDGKVTPFSDLKVKLEEEEAQKLGRKDPDAYPFRNQCPNFVAMPFAIDVNCNNTNFLSTIF